jgi:hypothetical protein
MHGSDQRFVVFMGSLASWPLMIGCLAAAFFFRRTKAERWLLLAAGLFLLCGLLFFSL